MWLRRCALWNVNSAVIKWLGGVSVRTCYLHMPRKSPSGSWCGRTDHHHRRRRPRRSCQIRCPGASRYSAVRLILEQFCRDFDSWSHVALPANRWHCLQLVELYQTLRATCTRSNERSRNICIQLYGVHTVACN